MSSFGPSIASSVAGAPQAERQAVERSAREDRDKARTRGPARKDPETPVDQVELTDAVRSLKDNTQEEAQDDRQERPQYGARGRLVQKREGQGQVDLQG